MESPACSNAQASALAAFLEHKKEWSQLRKLTPLSVRWMIVCWEDDLKSKEEIPGVEVVSLQKFADDPELVLNPIPTDLRSQSAAAARFDWQAASLEPHQQAVLAQLRRFGENRESGFSLAWRKGDSARFSVTCESRGRIGFGASARGTIGVPFSKWHVDEPVKSFVISQLNAASLGVAPHLDFSDHGRRKKGYDIEVLLPDQGAVDRFLKVWRDVVAELNQRSLT